MTEFSQLLQQGAGNAWLFVPSAVLLGALHGLEPGHSKTMMAAFIVAIRGTVWQAVLLGLSATLSHTAVVWAVALVGLHYGSQFDAGTSEPYFQVASAVLILSVAGWMIYRTRKDQIREQAESDPDLSLPNIRFLRGNRNSALSRSQAQIAMLRSARNLGGLAKPN